MERRWLKVREAAQYLGINPKTLYDLLGKGEITHVRRKGIGIRVDKTKLDELMESSEIPSIQDQLM